MCIRDSFEDDPNLFDGRQFYTDGPHIHEYLKELNLNSFGKDEDLSLIHISIVSLIIISPVS